VIAHRAADPRMGIESDFFLFAASQQEDGEHRDDQGRPNRVSSH